MMPFRAGPRFGFLPLGASLLGALLLVCWLLRPAHAEPQAPTTDKLRDLKKQRLEALTKLVAITAENYKHGGASSEDLWAATRIKDEAELDLCNSKSELIVVLERIVQEAKQVEEQNEKLVANKLGSESRLLRAKADRIQQEIHLEEARSK